MRLMEIFNSSMAARAVERNRRKTEPNNRYAELVCAAQHETWLSPISQEEVKFIVNTANRRYLNLGDLHLESFDSLRVGYHRSGLFTLAYLQTIDTATGNILFKVGVAKRNTKDKENESIARNIALWRAVLASPVRIPQ